MKPAWKDETRHGKVDSSEIRLGVDRLIVHRHIDSGPDVWLMSFYSFGLDKIELASKELEAAKKEALKVAKLRLDRALGAIDEALS